jgi:N-acyl-D-aspartate/D-glutamate deacylase
VTDGGPAATEDALADPAVRARVALDIDRYWRFLAAGSWDRARPLNSREHPELNGIPISEIAASRGVPPVDVFLDLIRDAGAGMTDLWMLGDLFREQHMVDMVTHPLFLLGADTMSSTMAGPMWERMRHNPISFAAHLWFLRRYALELRVLTVEAVVHKMTGLVAARYRLPGRGVLAPGAAADIAVIDLARLDPTDAASGGPTGVEHVVVNGTLVIAAGVHTGARPGRHLAAAAA